LRATTLVSGVDYMAGEVVVEFTASSMPSFESMPLGSAQFGISAVDTFLARHGVYSLEHFMGGTVNECVTEAGRRLERTFLIMYEDSTDAQAIAETLATFQQFEYAEINRIFHDAFHGIPRYDPPTSTEIHHQWYLDFPGKDRADIDAPEAWAITRGDPVVIVILDSGTMVDTCGAEPTCSTSVDWTLHSDFHHLWIEEEDALSDGLLNRYDINQSDDDGDSRNDNVIGSNFAVGYNRGAPGNYQLAWWQAVPTDLLLIDPTDPRWGWACGTTLDHGTQVASVAAATVDGSDAVGVAHQSRICWVRVGGGPGGSFDQARTAESIRYAALHGSVVNMSWGFYEEVVPVQQVLRDAVSYAANEKGCVLVASVGNGDHEDRVTYPAKDPVVLAVGALDTLATDGVTLSSYSNYKSGASWVDVVAPVDGGIWVDRHTECESSCPCPMEEYTADSGIGTSFAAPQATGIAALIRARFPALNQVQVRDRIKRSAEYYWLPSDSSLYGAGKVNAYRALTEWGTIASDTSWGGVSGMPDTLYVAGDLAIAEGATLTINGGAVVRIAPGDVLGTGAEPDRVEIVVEGTLTAIGTPGEPIIFESFTDSVSTESDWVGIRFEAGSKAVLRHVIIRNATSDIVIEEFTVSDSTWTEDKTLYLNTDFAITSDLTIASDEDLYVLGESDVIVTGGSDVEITVNGSLVCKGSTTKKPEFRSSTGTGGSWDLITLAAGSSGNVFENATIRHAEIAIRTFVPLTVTGCLFTDGVTGIHACHDVTVGNTTFHDLSGSAVHTHGGGLVVDDVEVYNAGLGISEDMAMPEKTVTCTDSYFHDLTAQGIYLGLATAGVTVRRTLIEDALDGIKLGSQSVATIDSCTIRNNDIGVTAYLLPDVVIEHTRLDGNTTAGVWLAAAAGTTMEADTVANSAAGVLMDYGSGGTIQGQTRITNNEVGVRCDHTSSPVIESTLISENDDGVAALDGSNPNLGFLGSADSCGASATGNSIHTHTGHHVINLSPEVTIAAEGNWWGGQAPKSTKFSGAVDRFPYDCDSLPPFDPSAWRDGGEPEPEPTATLPTRYDLALNQPNPFNPTTMMRYDVPAPGGIVRIEIFDVSGRRVRTLLHAPQPPGTHVATWNGENERGEAVASGVYFVRMSAAAFTQTRKAVLLK
jgi:hypothetical protein